MGDHPVMHSNISTLFSDNCNVQSIKNSYHPLSSVPQLLLTRLLDRALVSSTSDHYSNIRGCYSSLLHSMAASQEKTPPSTQLRKTTGQLNERHVHKVKYCR
ncbi:hypothetical protein EMCRGX_G029044 [Ephydatia muelleri]